MNNEGISETQNISIEREVSSENLLAETGERLTKALEQLDALISRIGDGALAPEEREALKSLGAQLEPENVPTF